MTTETIVAVYDTSAHADAAVRDLEAANVPSSAISRHSGGSDMALSEQAAPVREKGFWASLFGGEPDHDSTLYDRSLEGGSSVVAVKVSDEHVDVVTDILERHNPVDMDERAASYGMGAGMGGTTTTTTTAVEPAAMSASPALTPSPTTGTSGSGTMGSGTMGSGTVGTGRSGSGEEVLALSEEQVTVGKRLVNRGTTRIRRFVVETPVEEAVTLHSEHVSVERRPVTAGAAVSNADFTDRTIEVTETDEEAVVAKTARVTEEVVVNKSAADRVETVRDTVRREDVEITRDGDTKTTAGTTATGTTPTGTTPTGPKI